MDSAPTHLGHLDAIRGLAILGVVLVHVSGPFADLEGPARLLTESGARGVQLFFAASAYTLLHSWQSRNDGAGNFYIRRLFRIAPMFWLAMLFYLLVRPAEYSFFEIASAALFINGWHPELIFGPVPGGWSIATEMAFYLVFPLLVGIVTTGRRAVALLLISSSAAIALYPLLEPHVGRGFALDWIGNQLPAFAAGFVAYYAARNLPRLSVRSVFAGIAGVAVYLLLAPKFAHDPVVVPLYAIPFGVLIFLLGSRPVRLLDNPATRWIGQRSYSIYLIHFALVDLMLMTSLPGHLILLPAAFLLVLVASAAIASITLRFERWGVGLGRAIIKPPALPDGPPGVRPD